MYSSIDAVVDLAKAVVNIAGLIFFIIGITKAVQRLKLSRLNAHEFPEVDPLKFAQWQRAQLKATDIFLLAAWGAFLIRIALTIVTYGGEFSLGGALIFITLDVLLIVGWVVGLIAAYVLGRKAAWLQVEADIDWPKRPAQGRGPSACPECGMRYDPSDYRDDAPEWRCSACGSQLDRDSMG